MRQIFRNSVDVRQANYHGLVFCKKAHWMFDEGWQA